MDAVGFATKDRPSGSVHFERFSAKGVPASAAADGSFRIKLSRKGTTLTVPSGHSILQTLEDHGIELPCSCREGLCRTCETPLLAGKADHRDFVLSDEERKANTSIIPCVSRALDDELVLDL
jgi:vanillate O-demethylase ferredoxin subunit